MSRGFSEGFLRSKKDGKDSLSFQDKQKLIPGNLRLGVSIKLDGADVVGNYNEIIFSAGNTPFYYQNDGSSASHYTSSTVITLIRRVTMLMAGVIRVSFSLKTNGGSTAYGQLYKNGSPIGTLRSNTTTTEVTYTEDVSVAVNDKIEVWGYVASSGLSMIPVLELKAAQGIYQVNL